MAATRCEVPDLARRWHRAALGARQQDAVLSERRWSDRGADRSTRRCDRAWYAARAIHRELRDRLSRRSELGHRIGWQVPHAATAARRTHRYACDAQLHRRCAAATAARAVTPRV